MIIEELLDFQREVLSKEKDKETKYIKLQEFLHAKGFSSPESQQLLIDCLDATGQSPFNFGLGMILTVKLFVILILAGDTEIVHPVFFTISASVIGALLFMTVLIVRQMISNERAQISKLIRRKLDKYRLKFSDN